MAKAKSRTRRGLVNMALSFVLAVGVWAIMQTQPGQDSFLPAADNESLDWAFQFRDNQAIPNLGPTVMVDIDDDAWSGAVERGSAAIAYAPREEVLRALELARGGGGGARPAAVIVDVDLSWRSPDTAAELQIDALLNDWRDDPDAPLLILVREPASGDDTPDAPSRFPDPARAEIFNAETPEGPIVAATARTTYDDQGRPEEFNLYSCVEREGVITALANPVLFATVARRAPDARAAAERVNEAMEAATEYCRGERSGPGILLNAFDRGQIKIGSRTSFINYNVSVPLEAATSGRVQIARNLLMFSVNTQQSRIIPVGSGLPAVVIIGSSSTLARDYFRTPLGEMSGSAILVNALRGFEAAGPLGSFPPLMEIAMIAVAVVVISGFFTLARAMRESLPQGPQTSVMLRFGRAFARFMLNPVTVEILASMLVIAVGFTITYLALDYGYFAGIAGPSFAAAFNEARQEFEELTADVWGKS